MEVKRLPLSIIKSDTKFQARFSGTEEEVLEDYRVAVVRGDKFPPISVFHIRDEYFLVDGFHRTKVYRELGIEGVECEIYEGETEQDALDWVWSNANRKNGQRLSRKDLRYMIFCVLCDERYENWSNRQIAEMMNTSHITVSSVRKENQQDTSVVIGSDGKTYRFQKPITKKNLLIYPETHEKIEKYEISSSMWERLPMRVRSLLTELLENDG